MQSVCHTFRSLIVDGSESEMRFKLNLVSFFSSVMCVRFWVRLQIKRRQLGGSTKLYLLLDGTVLLSIEEGLKSHFTMLEWTVVF